MRRDFRYTGIHNIQNSLKLRRNFRWKAGLPLKKIRIQRVSVFDIAVTLLLAVVIIALAVRGTRELAKMKTTTDDYIQCETLARQLQSGSDYLVAFTPLGLAGLFKGKKWGIFVGTVAGCLGRFVVHYISGVTIYKILAPTEFMKWTFTSPSAYSLVYNGSYMLPNTIIALVIAAVLYKPLKKYILGQDLGN